MLDTAALQQLVEQQVKQEVSTRVGQALNEAWLKTVEDNAIKFIQDRIVAKFANSAALPELVDAVKVSVKELFVSGHLPGLGQYVDYDDVKKSVNDSTQNTIQKALDELALDPLWIKKIETLVGQQATQKVLAKLSATDIRPIVQDYISTIITSLNTTMFKGVQSQSKNIELTVLDQHVVVENQFTAKSIEAVESLTVKNLVVKGSINTDNKSWNELANAISDKTFNKLTKDWTETLIQQVRESITSGGIDFANIKVDGELLVNNGVLSAGVKESKLTSVGTLKSLNVSGDTKLNETVNVGKQRVGINTEEPDMALSVWDEEVSISTGKYKQQVGYIGTTRKQGLVIGINRAPAIEITEAGLTTVKQLQVGFFKLSHGTEVPNYSGTKGDIVFNSNPSIENPVFAWQCLGGFKWKLIKAVE
jgi:hypothetical protein